MSNDINVLGSLLRQLQQASSPSSGSGASGVQGPSFAGQKLPPPPADFDNDGDTGAGPAPAANVASQSPPSQRFSADLLGSLLQSQTQPPTSADVAKQLITNLDSNGDGNLSLAEVQKALNVSSTAATASTSASDPLSQLTQAFAKADGNGDGQLSSDELAAVLDKALANAQAGNVGPHHHRHHAYQAAQASADSAASSTAASGTSATTATTGSSTTPATGSVSVAA